MKKVYSRKSARNESRKLLLMTKMTRAIVPVARALLADLCVELRKASPRMRDIRLLESFLVDRDFSECRQACDAIMARYTGQTGMRIASQELHAAGDGDPFERLLTLRFSLDAWGTALQQLVDPGLSPCLEVQLRASRSNVLKGRILGMDHLPLVVVEQAHAVFQNYWLDRLATVATPMTSTQCETDR